MNKEELDLLDKILTKTNDWLKFAEAKNGALIAVVCAVMFGFYRAASNLVDIPFSGILYLSVFFALSILSLSIALVSFLPRLKKPFWITYDLKKDSDNPFYFGDAYKYTGYEYLNLLNINSTSDEKRILEKAADQIVVNSRISFLKYRLFTTATWLFLSAFLTPIGALIIWAFRE